MFLHDYLLACEGPKLKGLHHITRIQQNENLPFITLNTIDHDIEVWLI